MTMIHADVIEYLKAYNFLSGGRTLGVRTWVWDPPYNIGYSYSDCADNMTADMYADWIKKVASLCSWHSLDDANLFFIHYPADAARLLPYLEKAGWELKQWLTWVYPSNFGHSKNKFTTASRAVLHLVKGNPSFNHVAVQPYRNPNDKRIRKLIENGSNGTAHYDWLQVNLVKNVSAEKRYTNQIPEALLEILILNTTVQNDLVGDPTCGSGSTCRTAKRIDRRFWGCDISEDAVKCWGDLE